MGLFDLVWNVHQQRRLNEAQDSIGQQARDGQTTQRSVEEMRAMIDRLALTNQALWEFISEQTGLTEDDLAQRIENIDLRDGVADGRITPQTVSCPACGRPNRSTRSLCLYCGLALTASTR